MRAALNARVGRKPPDHVGLGYDRWAPFDSSTGKVPDDIRRSWLDDLAGTPIASDYASAYERWQESLKAPETRMAEVKLASRLLVGHGNPSPIEVGLTVHHTWGVPVIPGSALKGLLNHYVDAVYGPAVTGFHPMDPGFPQEERARAPFQGVTWNGKRIEHGPGEVHRALFGAPPAQSDRVFEAFGAGEIGGLVVFHDALFVPSMNDGERPFAVDVLTVHQRSYYQAAGKRGSKGKDPPGPNDYEDPNPVAFLTVRPGTRFLVAMSGPDEWTELAFRLLRDALIEWGVGGKTTSGYGRIGKDGWNSVWREPPPPPPSIVEELHSWLSTTAIEQRAQLEQLRGPEWLPRLRAASLVEREEIGRLLRKQITSKKRIAERDQLIAEILDGAAQSE